MKIMDNVLGRLKSKTILDRKPKLKICSNHLRATYIPSGRYWNSSTLGQAIGDGNGWYK